MSGDQHDPRLEVVAAVIRAEVQARLGEPTGREMSEQIAALVLQAADEAAHD